MTNPQQETNRPLSARRPIFIGLSILLVLIVVSIQAALIYLLIGVDGQQNDMSRRATMAYGMRRTPLTFHWCSASFSRCPRPRHLSAASRQYREQQGRNEGDSFRPRLRRALRDTKIVWAPIPIGLGIGFLGLIQFYRVRRRRQEAEDERQSSRDLEGGEDNRRPRKRARIRPSGSWLVMSSAGFVTTVLTRFVSRQVQAMYILPLKAISRYWGRFNELELPYYLRVPGFKLYAWIFGVNLSEVAEQDLHAYPNLAAFFYRQLKPGCRPLDPNPLALLSPADGRVLQFGSIEGGEVEQVKGLTYSLDALLGSVEPENPADPSASLGPQSGHNQSPSMEDDNQSNPDEEFARVNGISYTLPNLFSGSSQHGSSHHPAATDLSTTPPSSSEAVVRADLELGKSTKPWYTRFASKNDTALYYAVIYLAPGDYHRFHSPAAWVVEKRRHFAGELYSVSPYLQRKLPGLFTLNERVVLLGRWRWGFFSFVPVGATNVGSIKINFDKELRTNSLTTDTAADKAAEEAASRGEVYSGYVEATYKAASQVLGGYPLQRGEEIGGFQLGSSIVMVFEAPASRKKEDSGSGGSEEKGGWVWCIEKGQKVKMGQALGWVEEGS